MSLKLLAYFYRFDTNSLDLSFFYLFSDLDECVEEGNSQFSK